MRGLLDLLAALAGAVVAVPAALLPRRHWDSIEALPVRQASGISGFLTATLGLAFGGRGLLAYLSRAADASVDTVVDFVGRQVRGEVPPSADVTTWDLQRLSIFSLVAFLLFTPTGLLSLYLVATGVARALAAWFDDPFGDPLLTGVDALSTRAFRGIRDARAVAARRRAEGPEVPDRLYTGDWAGLEGVDFVVVASRRKPGWVRGTFILTTEKWYTLGEPFDLRLREGLRTVYPLTAQTVTEVLRRGVPYDLPPLGRGPRSGAPIRDS